MEPSGLESITSMTCVSAGTPNAMISLSSYLSLSSPIASIARGVKALNMQAATSGVALRAASIIVWAAMPVSTSVMGAAGLPGTARSARIAM